MFVLQFGVNMALRAHRIRAAMIAHLERTFGRRVDVQQFAVSLFPLPSLDADGITVGEDPAFGNEYFLRADRLSARLRLLSLFGGHLEFGTLSLDHPSLILVKNAEGRWNLERWLPPATFAEQSAAAKSGPAKPAESPANRLAKIEITDGRVNFKLGDDKKPFAFTAVTGSVEQIAFGRWQINLEAQPWRSGVQLQTTGTIQVQGEVAGTSVRLRPARLRIRWTRASLADIVRLARGQDEGVRGLFDLDATAESGTKAIRPDAPPGEWSISLNARASEIHRWDLTQRADNPKLSLQAKGRWLPNDGSINVDELLVTAPKSNVRGTASFSTVPQTNFAVHLDSAGIQASDLLAWYRAFAPGVAESVSVDQYFTGGATFSGWPIKLDAAAFSSLGGRISLPDAKNAIRVAAVRGGMEKNSFVIEPASFVWAREPVEKDSAAQSPELPKGKSAGAAPTNVAIGLRYDFDSREGSVSIAGQSDRSDDIFKTAAAFGKQLNHGWEWSGPVNANLQRKWGTAPDAGWNGQVTLQRGELQIVGLNQPVKVTAGTLSWQHGSKTAELKTVEAFGGEWDGEIAENPVSNGAAPQSRWRFKLHGTTLTAADLDRWAGPRARPNWLQRLLPAMLGGSSGQNVDATDLLRQIDADGDLAIDEFNLEKIKLKQVRTHASLRELHLRLRDCQVQWAGGNLQGDIIAAFDAKPVYELNLQATSLNLAQVPLAGKVAERITGILSGSMNLKTEGVGRDVLLDKLTGEGRIQLKKIEFRGWDVQASMVAGSPHAGASKWTDGEAVFHVSGRSLEVNHLLLRAPPEQVSLKGSVSFGREVDLTLGSEPTGKAKSPRAERVMQISGPLEGPKVSIQTISAQQPGD